MCTSTNVPQYYVPLSSKRINTPKGCFRAPNVLFCPVQPHHIRPPHFSNIQLRDVEGVPNPSSVEEEIEESSWL